MKIKLKIARARYRLNELIAYILKIAVAVALGITLADMAAPLLGM